MSDLASRLRLRRRNVLVVGGPERAVGTVGGLVSAGALVTVVAPEVATSIQDLAERGALTWRPRPAVAGDLDGVALVVLADASQAGAEAGEVVAAAEAGGILVADLDEGAVPGMAPAAGAGEPGSVVLVGGGPGEPGLLTLAGLDAIRRADVVVVDRLAPIQVLEGLGPDVEVVDVGKIPRGRSTSQERINEVLVEKAREGKRVVRLKGGDSFVFGRGMEEVLACRAAGVPVDIVPGVTSAVAAPELAGIPVTHRGVVQGFAVVSGHVAPDDARSTVDWAALGASGITLVVLMGVATLPAIAEALRAAGRPEDTPIACVMEAAGPRQRVATTTLGRLAGGELPEGFEPPAVTVIGEVAAFAGADPVGSDAVADLEEAREIDAQMAR